MKQFTAFTLFILLSIQAWAQDTIPFRGVFVSRIEQELNTQEEVKDFVDYMNRHDLNSVMVYGASGRSTNSQEAARIFKNRVSQLKPEVTWVAVSQSENDLIRAEGFYDPFDAFMLECEWWVKWFPTYRAFKRKVEHIQLIKPEMDVWLYIGWLKNRIRKAEKQAEHLVNYADVICIHDYEEIPSHDFIQERLELIGKAAEKAGKKVKIVILFSAEKKFSSNALIQNKYLDVYTNVIYGSQRVNAEASWLSFIDFHGFSVFSYNRRHQ